MVQQDRDILAAAEALLGSSSSYQNNVNYSINSPMEPVYNQDIITGSRDEGRMSVISDEGRISVVRRFFCLFVTFDLLFIVLMWLICIMLSGDDVFSALSKQVVHYNIRTSLFDIVLSTAGTCAFLISKVFVYDWPKAQLPVFQVLLILISFVLAWGEAWFLDFRVLPQESQAARFSIRGSSIPSRFSERAPLLKSFLQTLPPNDDIQESVRNFYSPMESPRGSDVEEEPEPPKIPDRRTTQENRYQGYLLQCNDIVETALRMLNAPDWRLEKTTVQGDIIHSKKIRGSKIYRMTGVIDVLPSQLLDLLFYDIEDLPSWNPTILKCKRVEVIDDQTDIIYQVTAEAGGGIVASRDFVNLRHWVLVDNSYVSAAVSITHPSHPPHKKYIRGEHGPSCWVMEPLDEDPTKCAFQWLLNTNLRGWLPQSVVDAAFSSAMKDYMANLRTHAGRTIPRRI
ncbi:steroidogenic acute regulatory protein-like isoform X2 [Anabrus simplex]|uniref:steroidogenic acute regulatory protein-like isoform X2 n=1 Tax=Anabrus simplex TaxID=316456 RepID=UPI0035A28DC4